MLATETAINAAAEHAADLVAPGTILGLGSGSTVTAVIDALARRGTSLGGIVAASPSTARTAKQRGLPLVSLDEVVALDLAIDGADQVGPGSWVIKGGGGAHTRERIVLAAARQTVIVVDEDKLVSDLEAPVPVEILAFGSRATLARLGAARLRDEPPSPDGGLIADYLGPINDPQAAASTLSATPGVVAHGLFPPDSIDAVIVGFADGTTRMVLPRNGR